MKPNEGLARAILACMLMGGASTPGQTPDMDGRALLDLRHEERGFDITALEPRKGFLGQPSHDTTATAVLSGDLATNDLVAQGQLRTLRRSSTGGSTWSVDEVFLETPLTESVFVFAGRRNIAFGQAYGVNPSDVFLDLRAEDQGLSFSRQRQETKGQDMLGFEAFVTGNATLLCFAAPSNGFMNPGRPDRFLASINLLFANSNTDMTLLAFEDDRPGVAGSISKTFGNALVAYADGTVRKGRDRNMVEPVGPPGVGFFQVHDAGDDDWLPSLTVGGVYTFASGLELSLEYFRNGVGYDSGEWRVLRELAQTNASMLETRFAGMPSPEINLKRLNGVLNSIYLRENYALARLSMRDAFWPGLEVEAVLLQNLDDGSGVFSARLEQDVRQWMALGAYIARQHGDDFSEFGLRAASTRGILYATLRF